jgi:sphingomyelin phosphodiesterase acid-like 3
MLNGAANHQDFLASFTAAGYYAAEPAGTNVMVIGLNTIMFSPLVQNTDGSENNQAVVDAELAWFDSKLASAKAAGKRVWLLMHAPPGADEGTTAQSVQANGQIASAAMMWEANYQATFMQVLSKYPEVITMTLAGHTHMDEYRIMSAGNVVEITPGISPCFNNDPAYKIYRLNRNTLAPSDYSSLNYDLTTMPAQFNNYYTYSQAYPLAGSLESSLERLFPKLAADAASQASYRGHFYSGNNSMNPITNTNWPIYWTGIGIMSEKDIVAGVNSYQ